MTAQVLKFCLILQCKFLPETTDTSEVDETASCHNKGTNAAPVEIGDIVVVHSDKQPRGFWKVGRVKRTITGRDGKTRGAAVRVTTCQGRPILLHRPIQSLEISLQEKAVATEFTRG